VAHLERPPIALGFSHDGVDDRVEVADAVELRLLPPFTLAAWVYPRTLPRLNNDVIQKRYDYLINVQSSRKVMLYNSNPDLAVKDYLISASLLPLNEWSHIVGVWRGVNENFTYEIYINGILDASKSSTLLCYQSTYPLRMGRWSAGRELDGIIAEPSVYDRALSSAEIGDLYSVRRNIMDGCVLKLGTVGLVRGGGTQWLDESPYKNHGTVYGAKRVRCCHCNVVRDYGT